jgi:hypothetical protein
MMLILDKERRLGVWYSEEACSTGGDGGGFDSSRLGRIAALVVLIAGYDIIVFRGLPRVLLYPAISHVSSTASSFTCNTVLLLFAIDSLILIRAICLKAPGHYQPRKRVGGCISTWVLRTICRVGGSAEVSSATVLSTILETRKTALSSVTRVREKGGDFLCMAFCSSVDKNFIFDWLQQPSQGCEIQGRRGRIMVDQDQTAACLRRISDPDANRPKGYLRLSKPSTKE